MSLLFAMLIGQVGPFVSSAQPPASPLPPEVQQRQAIERRKQAPPPPAAAAAAKPAPQGRLGDCLQAVAEQPDAAAEAAQAWLDAARGAERAEAGECLGSALVALGRFDEAVSAYLLARDVAAPGDHDLRARVGAMAGNAALAQGDAPAALAALDLARSDAGAAAGKRLASGIAADRARALVMLKREPEAAAALADARASDPANAQAWLLSATLSRRMGKLAEAQSEIEQAAALLPVDPDIGLEAGVIAMLSGHEEAARKSWQSVVAAAPQSDAAATAGGYLAQLDQPSGGTR